MATRTSRTDHDQATSPGSLNALAQIARLLARQSADECVGQSQPPTSQERTDANTNRKAHPSSYRR